MLERKEKKGKVVVIATLWRGYEFSAQVESTLWKLPGLLSDPVLPLFQRMWYLRIVQNLAKLKHIQLQLFLSRKNMSKSVPPLLHWDTTFSTF